MKKIAVLAFVLVLLISLAGCLAVSIPEDAEGKVVYDINGIFFEDYLTAEEVAAVVKVLDGKSQNASIFSGAPSCGFDRNVAIIINGTRYALACDKCGTVQNCSTLAYIHLSDAEREILEEIFTSRGGKFPCI